MDAYSWNKLRNIFRKLVVFSNGWVAAVRLKMTSTQNTCIGNRTDRHCLCMSAGRSRSGPQVLIVFLFFLWDASFNGWCKRCRLGKSSNCFPWTWFNLVSFADGTVWAKHSKPLWMLHFAVASRCNVSCVPWRNQNWQLEAGIAPKSLHQWSSTEFSMFYDRLDTRMICNYLYRCWCIYCTCINI